MAKVKIRFGIIGCGLMGKEFASVAARWCHLENVDFEPSIIAVCDPNKAALEWFVNHIPHVQTSTNYKDLLNNSEVDAIYCAVPHNLHKNLYTDIINAGKHLLGEKPFGIDLEANQAIMNVIEANPDVLVRCSSEFPFYPGAYRISRMIRDQKFGKIIDVEAGFWHSSDMDPNKSINWKRKIETNGEYGSMGDLGLHTVHIPLQFGWKPHSVRALLSKIIHERPNVKGELETCETWDNAILACDVKTGDQEFPLVLSMKRMAPGHANTWFIRINGTECSAEFTTKNPKQLSILPYTPGQEQAWHLLDVPNESAYRTITGSIFEFGFSDSLLQMWAAFCDELVNKKNMQQFFTCLTPQIAAEGHRVFTAALKSNDTGTTILVN